jgi:hypothetical protein
VKIVLTVLRVNLLGAVATVPAHLSFSAGSADAIALFDQVAGADGDASPVFEMNLNKSGVTATPQLLDGEFAVHEGSFSGADWIGVGSNYQRLRDETRMEEGNGKSKDQGNRMPTGKPRASTAPESRICRKELRWARVASPANDTSLPFVLLRGLQYGLC